MAEGALPTAAITEELVIGESAVECHVTSVVSKLDLPAGEQDHRRVPAVLAHLRG